MKTQRIITFILILGLFTFLKEIEDKVVQSIGPVIASIKEYNSVKFDALDFSFSHHFKVTEPTSIFVLREECEIRSES